MTPSPSPQLLAAPADVAIHDYREAVTDLGACPLGLAHRRGDAGCEVFRRAAQAKLYRPPRSGWVCEQEASGS